MRELKIKGDVSIYEIFEDNRPEIYNYMLSAIKENYLNSEIIEITVVKILTQSKDHVINLTRDKFIASLNRCISFFEPLEEYEKCQVCVNMINDINENTLKKQTV